MTSPPSQKRALAELTVLYAAEGLPYGFFAQALPVLMRQQGVSLSKIGLLAVLYLPWALKGLWAPWVDTLSVKAWGRRRSWIVLTQAVLVLTLAAAAVLMPEGDINAMLPLLLVINVLSATQDIAVDGYAVSLLTARSRGLGNAIQVCGYKGGMVVGGGVLMGVLDASGVRAALGIQALLLLCVLPVGAFLAEPPRDEPPPQRVGDVFRVAVEHLWSRPGAASLLALVTVVKMGESAASSMLKPALVDRGMTLTDVGFWVGTAGLTASLLGSALGGLWVTRLARLSALRGAMVLQALGLMLLGVLVNAPVDSAAWAIVVEHLVTGVLTTVLFTFMMDAVDPALGGTEYTVLASLVVVGTSSAGMLSGPLAESVGYSALFGAGGLLTLLALPLAAAAERTRR